MFKDLLEKTARGLNEKKIPYMVIGGQALLLYGEPRLTKDIDIALGIGLEGLAEIKALVSALEFKPLVSDPESFVKETMVFPVAEEKSGIRIDFIFSFSLYEKLAIERAREIRLGQAIVRFASLEDVIIHKMLAGRPRDIEDIESILLKNPGYDAPYINKWLSEFEAALDRNYMSEFQALIEKLKQSSS
ncbi:MAG: nucleotidyl transferase AbiEii/AbiGii toxin family protein [Candidatus Aminicenantales bacterium]